jgi:hypothetical protein
VAYKRGRQAAGDAVDHTRDAPVDDPEGLAHEGPEAGRSRKPGGVRGSRSDRSHRSKRPLGIFHYQKQLAKESRLCQVRVFSFRVERQLDDWPEKRQRETKWFDPAEAAALVEEDGLHGIITRFAGSYVRFSAFRKTKNLKKRYRSMPARPPAD